MTDVDDDDEERPRGQFGQFGWSLHQGPLSDGVGARLVSAHELYHDRLQLTTAHGFLTHVTAALALETRREHWIRLTDGLQSFARRTHEQFATWCSTSALGLDRDDLATLLPGYAAFYDDVDTLVSDVPGAYLQLHVVHAIHRAAMQTGVLALVADRGVTTLRLADIGRELRPDWRLGRFTRSFVRSRLDDLVSELNDRWHADPRWASLLTAPLTDGLFAAELDDVWDDVNQHAYGLARHVLREVGVPTLDYDGHLDHTATVLEQARAVTGTRLGVSLSNELAPSIDADVAIVSMEGERLVIRQTPLPATVVRGVEPRHLLAGEDPYEHVYVSIRAGSRFAQQWLVDDAVFAGNAPIAIVRRTVETSEGRVVEVCIVDDPRALEDVERLVVADVSMEVLGNPDAMARWGRLISADRSVVLWDLQPSTHLRRWLAGGTSRLRYAVLNAERHARTTMVFVAQVVAGQDRSRLFVVPCSDLFVRSIRAWLSEAGLDDRVDLDLSLIEENDRVLQISLGHLLGEERIFDFGAGTAR